MTKHPLLPENYGDAKMHTSILHALKPYEYAAGSVVANPQLKWDLASAWDDAQTLLQRGDWHEDRDNAAWQRIADNEEEKDNLDIIIAGMVARQMLEPESGYTIRRIEHKTGGEMVLTISNTVAEVLKQDFPKSKFIAAGI